MSRDIDPGMQSAIRSAVRGVLALLGIALALSLFSPRGHADEGVSPDLVRQVDLEWEAVENADHYEFQFALSPDFNKTLYQITTKDLKFQVSVLPGSYYYRVRAFDDKGLPGHWTDIHELNVNARPPVLLYPADKSLIQGPLPDTGLPLEWRSSGPGIRYLVVVKGEDDQGQFSRTLVKQEYDGTIFPFFPSEPGRYQWSVHTVGPAGDEPGMVWVFTVEGVIPLGAKVTPGVVPKRIVRYISPWWRNHWWVWLRYGQSAMNYNIIDQDERATSNFNGFTGYAAITLNWEWHDPVNWLGQGIPWVEAELEADRETVLSESVILPRALMRFGSWYTGWIDSWKFAPIVEFGARDIAIYQARSTIEAVRATSTRQDIGVGAGAEYQIQPFLALGAQVKAHFESGGQAGFVPVAGTGDQFDPNSPRVPGLMPSVGFEADGTATLTLNSKLKVQGRLRYESFSAAWTPQFPLSSNAPASANGLTVFSYSDFNFDIAIGYHF